MNSRRRIPTLLCVLLLVSAFVPLASAQQPDGQASFRAAIAFEQKTSPGVRAFFSGALQNFLAIGHAMLDQPSGGPDSELKQGAQAGFRSTRVTSLRSGRHSNGHDPDEDTRTVQISSTSRDFLFSHVGGFTQNNSSSAWCGHNVVTAFQSSTGVVDTNLLPISLNNGNGNLPFSFVGVSVSRNDGKFFVDQGYVPAGDFPNIILGNPVLACSSANRFYLATSFVSGIIDPNDPFSFTPLAGIGISISNDGSHTWNTPVTAIIKDGSFHFIDKGWLAIDPSAPNRLYVSYTDFDGEGLADLFPAARCPGLFRVAIELVNSVDGGQTWSAPTILHEDCVPTVDPGQMATGSQVAVGRDGNVYVSYDVLPTGLQASFRPIRLAFRRSSRGQSFEAETTVDKVVPTANADAFFSIAAGFSFESFLQGNFRDVPFPAMAVDTSRNSRHDTIYIAWVDGRDNSQVDLILFDGKYHFGDILLTSSSDGGATWSKASPVSPMPPDSPGRDQFQPTIAIDSSGNLAVCYYDRRNDPANNAVDRYCSLSGKHGRAFQDIRQTGSSWIPVKGSDLLFGSDSLGDYDSMAAHKGSGAADNSGGFFDSFQVVKNEVTSVRGRRPGRDQ